jgi:Zn-dependent protease with chaperone function
MKKAAATIPLLMLLVLPICLLALSSNQASRVVWVENAAPIQHNITTPPPRESADSSGSPQSMGQEADVASPLHTQSVYTAHTGSTSRAVLARMGQALSGAAITLTLAWWLDLRYAARGARRSRDYLIERLPYQWQRLGPRIRTQVSLTALAAFCALLFELSNAPQLWRNGNATLLLVTLPLWAVLCGALALWLRMRGQFAPLPRPEVIAVGWMLSKDQAPAVWSWLASINARTGAPLPDQVVVGIDQVIFATQVPVVLHPEDRSLSGTTLYLPLTYLSSLDQAETAAIIGHELGHYIDAEAVRGSRLTLVWKQIYERQAALAQRYQQRPGVLDLPALYIHSYFIHLFEAAYGYWSQRQELAADHIGAAVSDGRTYASALLRVTALADLIAARLAGPRQDSLVHGLDEYLACHPLQLTNEGLTHSQSHPFGSHPPTLTRVQSLSVALDDALLHQATRPVGDAERHWFNALLNAHFSASSEEMRS